MGLQRAQGQRAALLGEHAEFAYQFPRQGAQGAGIHGVVSLWWHLVVMRNQYHFLVVDDNHLREKGRKTGRKKGPGEGPNIGNPRGGADPILGQ
ncbi:hypothetical protein KAM448_35990 [Aeromonas caviae]|uniref:Uncharacterized protein n=1 Tax=Aeromonas caviae TaxID=648 RepID=A0ABD0B588_AERCA|nr:hypothetical protein KAM359_30950 [Aeromonas caviae]GJB10699.1 hypothetical protein KAM362_12590 [Aeromonas caviae]GJB42750.1 hypothetical protein KAM369_32250 [Aeromonas caviae]GJB47381.1 hypothetical protein KAM370_33230 [Aeromonas caviae]GJB91100.1 hypothetical protein KAM382_11610 [Aeromonas caviae]